tara:strand:- start:6050 stop:9193 length:3144 start_codon:yes stop_codon:yes gene_type:complete
MSVRIAHIADVHFRPLSRHDEQRLIFEYFFEKAKELKVDLIYVGGDIYHTKTQGITPEVIDHMAWWFTELSKVAPTHVILGNHDGNMVNLDRQDAISPIVKALDNKRLFLYKQSGTYPTGIPGYNWSVFSCFDEEGWKDVKPVEGEINIATFHGCVVGSKTDQNWELEGDVPLSFFDPYDFTMLGDIHKQQFLTPDKRVAYSGSTSQGNYGEDIDKGFLVWDIRSRDDFDVNFHPLPNPHPFVTVDWKGTVQNTLKEAQKQPDGSRFRIRTSETIPQIEIKQIHTELKEQKQAKEVVWKFETFQEGSDIEGDASLLGREDLRDAKTQMDLLKSYNGESRFEEKRWEEIEDLVTKCVNKVARTDPSIRNRKWEIKELEFDNVFSYGKGNKINFKNLSGITGILGPNRCGKSSIVGTIVYTLFNSTDRGSIKNLHVINSRKGHCLSKATIGIGSEDYVIERQSVKKEDKWGKESAITSLNFSKVDPMGNVVQDLNGEQRTQTEKAIRGMLGNAEDFLLTSLATQGNMNEFINQGSSARKKILSRFLDLDMFDTMSGFLKESAAEIKGKLSSYPERDWSASIVMLQQKKKEYNRSIQKIEKDLIALRDDQRRIQIELAGFSEEDLITESDVKKQQEIVKDLSEKRDALRGKFEKCAEELSNLNAIAVKILEVKKQFPISEIREEHENLQDLERSLTSLEHARELEKQILSSARKLAKKLEPCDCFEHKPTCQYVKKSDKQNKLIIKHKEVIDEQSSELRAIRRTVKKLQDQNLKEKIDKHNKLTLKLSENTVHITQKKSNKDRIYRDLKAVEDALSTEEKLYDEMVEKSGTTDVSEVVVRLKNKLSEIVQDIQELDSKKMSSAELKGNADSQIKKLRTEKNEYQKLRKQWENYDFLLKSWSKKGIPAKIIESQLPTINQEISKILAGVTNFTVSLETDPETNAAEVYIDYGDSRRIIELASGMEKMISSLAIRVALLNICSLPKTNMLIIDEGFGTLDESNVEACNRLLSSLKKWFKNILVITHVDSVKDAVDNTLEITTSKKNSKINYD